MVFVDLCHLNTLHQSLARNFISHETLLVGTGTSARQLTRESFDRLLGNDVYTAPTRAFEVHV